MKRIRYAVVGVGHITQNALLPGFKNTKNSELVAIVTGDAAKRKEIARQYDLDPKAAYSYDDLETCLRTEKVDAVYLGVPNHLHCEYTVRAAKAGAHVLCEKPMAVTSSECQTMIDACKEAGTRLMIAYRLHFEDANLEAIRIATKGELGDLRIFTSVFSQQVAEGNIRITEPESRGGGNIYDMGVYCINAARYLFRDEPTGVFAVPVSNGDARFRKVPEMTSVTMRFPFDRVASFVSSFGAQPTSEYTLIGEKGRIRLSPAFDYQKPLAYELVIGEREPRHKTFRKRDQFGAQLEYFSECIHNHLKPEPSGEEGLADIRVVEAILQSAATGKWVSVQRTEKKDRPSEKQKISKPPVHPPELVHAASPSGKH
ncbi:MAG TPA: Gfo/Idh/MocA family oxidoreductase [Bryobacteraceae bacterium]|nr:Gfo/Idh/MocA family oxidoreductase [Bryobacteraceae bacterium]